MALMLMLYFSLHLRWFPAQGATAGWKSYVLPSIAIGFMNMAAIARTTRSSMLETIRQDYIRTARSKGISESEVVIHHAFQNALIPTITVIGVQLGQLIGGAVFTAAGVAMGLRKINAGNLPKGKTPKVDAEGMGSEIQSPEIMDVAKRIGLSKQGQQIYAKILKNSKTRSVTVEG